ncbi:hypothetical protein CO660_19975 [Rhizobium sp. L9]|nr:hypothetical protein CO660_19975 [Rhizobium sp. L9]
MEVVVALPSLLHAFVKFSQQFFRFSSRIADGLSLPGSRTGHNSWSPRPAAVKARVDAIGGQITPKQSRDAFLRSGDEAGIAAPTVVPR